MGGVRRREKKGVWRRENGVRRREKQSSGEEKMRCGEEKKVYFGATVQEHSFLNTMSLIHQAINTCAVGELDLHPVPITQKDILKTIPITKTTNNALTNTTTSFDLTF